MSGNSDHELTRKKRKVQKVKLAEAERETIELKISDDIVEDNSESAIGSTNSMLVPEAQSEEQAAEQAEEHSADHSEEKLEKQSGAQLEVPLQETIVAAETADESKSTPQPLPAFTQAKDGYADSDNINLCPSSSTVRNRLTAWRLQSADIGKLHNGHCFLCIAPCVVLHQSKAANQAYSAAPARMRERCWQTYSIT